MMRRFLTVLFCLLFFASPTQAGRLDGGMGLLGLPSEGDVILTPDIDGGSIDGATLGETAGVTIYQWKTIYIPTNVMTPTATNFATAGTHEYPTNDVNLDYYSFDGVTKQHIEYSRVLSEAWDLSTIKFKFHWAPGDSACTAGDTVEWAVTAEAISDDDPIDVASGVSQVVSDAVTAGKDGDLHITDATPALTVAGTPAAGDLIHFKFSRNVDGVDDMTEKGWMVGVFIKFREAILVPAW